TGRTCLCGLSSESSSAWLKPLRHLASTKGRQFCRKWTKSTRLEVGSGGGRLGELTPEERVHENHCGRCLEWRDGLGRRCPRRISQPCGASGRESIQRALVVYRFTSDRLAADTDQVGVGELMRT